MQAGDLCFIDDAFFVKVSDQNLKINYETTKRPHIIAFKENDRDLFWVVPCSRQIDKYTKILNRKIMRGVEDKGIMMVQIDGFKDKSALLFQDMFPVTQKYMIPYTRNEVTASICNTTIFRKILNNSHYCVNRLREGFWFSQTPPDVLRIQKIMEKDLQRDER